MRPTLDPLVLALSASLALAACSSTVPADAADTGDSAAADAPAAATAPAAPPASDPVAVAPAGPPPGASGKIAADMVGKVSPVPALRGFGEHWTIDIQATGDMAHRVELAWGSAGERAVGQLRYDNAAPGGRDAPILLRGTLDTARGPAAMTVEIRREACIDDGDNRHAHTVDVRVAGMDPLTGGCADLAVY